jgi:hypothetical protein
MSSTTDQVVLKLAEQVKEHEKQISGLLEAIESMQRNLTNAFKETGYDFHKIARIESSRRREAIQNNTEVVLDPEEFNPDFQDEVARRILQGKALTSNEDLIKLQHDEAPEQEAGMTQTDHRGGMTQIDPRAGLTQASNKGRKE